MSALRAGRDRAAGLLIAVSGRADGRAAGTMQGNGQQAGKGREDHLDGVGAADGGLQTAAVPMLPAMEVAEEPERPPGGKSKDPNTYKVLSLVRTGLPRGRAGGPTWLSPRRWERGERCGWRRCFASLQASGDGGEPVAGA